MPESSGPPEPIVRLIDEFHRLPGVGPKSAQRLAYHILRIPPREAAALAAAITDVKARITFCSICLNITEQDPCAYCSDDRR
ncbi:MAG: recombination protein RecR, partial [Tepidiformaceae bacterium]